MLPATIAARVLSIARHCNCKSTDDCAGEVRAAVAIFFSKNITPVQHEGIQTVSWHTELDRDFESIVHGFTVGLRCAKERQMKKTRIKVLLLCLVSLTFCDPVSADFINFQFQGNAGIGLLPDNEVGDGTAFGSGSPAFGEESGLGIVLDTDASLLLMNFTFEGLTDGLFFDAASGIHLHAADPNDPFNTTGPIIFNLNSFDDPNVANFTPQIKGGATSGSVTAVVNVAGFEEELLNGSVYLNIHSQAFNGGELRGNLVAIPEPSLAIFVLGSACWPLLRRRRNLPQK